MATHKNKKTSDKISLDIINWRDMKFRSFPEPRWLVSGIILENSITLIASEGGTGKTWFALDMARCVSEGVSFLNRYATIESPVLYLDGEMGLSSFKKRGNQLSIDKDNYNLEISTNYEIDFNNDDSVNYLLEKCKRSGTKLIIIDTFRAFCGSLNEFDAVEVRKFFRRFYQFRDSGIAVVFLDHTRKQNVNDKFLSTNSQVYGSQDKVSAIDSALLFRKSANHTNDRIIEVIQGKNRHGIENKPFGFILNDTENNKIRIDFTETQERKTKSEIAEIEILKTISSELDGISAKDIQKILIGRVGKTQIENTLKSLIESGCILRSNGKPPLYSIAELISEDAETAS